MPFGNTGQERTSINIGIVDPRCCISCVWCPSLYSMMVRNLHWERHVILGLGGAVLLLTQWYKVWLMAGLTSDCSVLRFYV